MSNRSRRLAASRSPIEGAGSTVGTRTGRPTSGFDRIVPTAFSTPVAEPDPVKVRRQMVAFIDEGIRMHVFDQGSYAFIDQWVAMKLDGWLTHLEDEFRLRHDGAAWIVGGRIENLSVASGVLAEAQGLLADLDDELARLRAVLRGPHPAIDGSAAPDRSERGVAPIPGALLDAASLRSGDEPTQELSAGDIPLPPPSATIHAVETAGPAQSAQSR